MDNLGTQEKRDKFLEVLADTCNVRKACEISDLPRSSAYRFRSEDETFRNAWDRAIKIGADSLEEEAVRRAREGWDEPVFYKGEHVSTIRKYSDTLLIFLLKGNKPEKYGDKVQNVHSGNLTVYQADKLASLSLEELNSLERITRKLTASGTDSSGTQSSD